VISKRLRRIGLLLLAGPAASIAGAAAGAPAADKIFTVANYPVEVQAKDAVTAKEKALADGQQAAFRSLLKRLVPVTAYNRMERLKSAKAADLIDGVAVRTERNSATKYIASLDFSFQADAVRDLLRREGVPFIDVQAPPVVLVPVTRRDPDYQGGGPWGEAWKDLDLDNTLTPVKLEALRGVIHPDTLNMLVNGTGGAERILAGEYKSEQVVAAVAEIDSAAKRIHVTVAGRDAIGPIFWKRSYRLTDGDTAYAMEFAAVVTLGVLEGRWKAMNTDARGGVDALAAPGVEVLLDVEFNSLAEWNELRRQLLDTPGVEDLRVGAVSARNAEVALKFPGGGPRLASTLADQGLILRNSGDYWLLRSDY
jgi:hypothetical protein